MNYIEYLNEVELSARKSKREVSEEEQEKFMELVEDQQFRFGEKYD